MVESIFLSVLTSFTDRQQLQPSNLRTLFTPQLSDLLPQREMAPIIASYIKKLASPVGRLTNTGICLFARPLLESCPHTFHPY